MWSAIKSLFGGRVTGDPREQFAAEAEAYLRAFPTITSARRVDGEFALAVTATNRGSLIVELLRIFEETREASPEERHDRMRFFFAEVVADRQAPTWDEARRQLLPVLRPVTAGIDLSVMTPGAGFVRRPFLPFIDECAVVDSPTAMSFVCTTTLTDWKVSDRYLRVVTSQDSRLARVLPRQGRR